MTGLNPGTRSNHAWFEAWKWWARLRNNRHDTAPETVRDGRATLDHPGACLNCSDGPHRDGAGGCTRYTAGRKS